MTRRSIRKSQFAFGVRSAIDLRRFHHDCPAASKACVRQGWYLTAICGRWASDQQSPFLQDPVAPKHAFTFSNTISYMHWFCAGRDSARADPPVDYLSEYDTLVSAIITQTLSDSCSGLYCLGYDWESLESNTAIYIAGHAWIDNAKQILGKWRKIKVHYSTLVTSTDTLGTYLISVLTFNDGAIRQLSSYYITLLEEWGLRSESFSECETG